MFRGLSLDLLNFVLTMILRILLLIFLNFAGTEKIFYFLTNFGGLGKLWYSETATRGKILLISGYSCKLTMSRFISSMTDGKKNLKLIKKHMY